MAPPSTHPSPQGFDSLPGFLSLRNSANSAIHTSFWYSLSLSLFCSWTTLALSFSLSLSFRGPVYSAGHFQSGLFQKPLAVLTLISIVNSLSSTILRSGYIPIFIQKGPMRDTIIQFSNSLYNLMDESFVGFVWLCRGSNPGTKPMLEP